jgi:hypothetical protein
LGAAIPQSEADNPPGAELLRDMSKAASQRDPRRDLEAELMRLADDPLRLRALLDRPSSQELQQCRRSFPVIPPIHHRDSLGDPVSAAHRLYAQREPLRPSSDVPSAFVPSGDDREAALILTGQADCPLRATKPVRAGSLRGIVLFLILAVIAATVLF